jgi:predicted secreted Zn-dependent protease
MNCSTFLAALAGTLLLAGFSVTEVHADVKVSEKVETYRVAGTDGEALMNAMDRNGPRHGFLARAIAQTRYSVNWDIAWKVTDDEVCRVKAANVKLSINYRYPELTGKPTPYMKRSWAVFMKGVRKHERHHGRVARLMAGTAQKTVAKIRVPDDPSCRKAKREVSRVVKVIYAKYEAEQARFDALEHAPGGTVDRLVTAFIKGK